MKKDYQKTAVSATGPVLPEAVSIALSELAGDVQEGLLAMGVGAGLRVMAAMMSADVEAVCGPKGKHDPDRSAVRHGTGEGSVTLGGRRVPVQRPRMRAVDGSGELPLASYETFSSSEVLGRMAMGRMLAGLSTRRYPLGLEPVGERVEQVARSTSKSAVSRRFVAATETALGEMLAADLSGLDLVALMIDGVHFGEHLCVVALGIGIDGTKHPLGLAEGSTENTAVVTDLLTGLRERGLDTTRPIFVGIDGGKALHAAVIRVFFHPVIQRCQLHKIRNVADKLPDHLASTVTKRMRKAYHAESALHAQAQLEALAKELDRTHPGAAGSLREGMAETLTVLRLGVSPTLARTLRSTNCIESMISVARDHSTNVKNWQNGTMALRWCAAGMIEARGQFRRVNGHLHLPALLASWVYITRISTQRRVAICWPSSPSTLTAARFTTAIGLVAPACTHIRGSAERHSPSELTTRLLSRSACLASSGATIRNARQRADRLWPQSLVAPQRLLPRANLIGSTFGDFAPESCRKVAAKSRSVEPDTRSTPAPDPNN